MPRATNRQRSAARATRPLAVEGPQDGELGMHDRRDHQTGRLVGRSDSVPARSAAPTSRRHRAPAAARDVVRHRLPTGPQMARLVFRAQIGRGQLVQSGPDLHRGGVDLGSEPHQLTGDPTAGGWSVGVTPSYLVEGRRAAGQRGGGVGATWSSASRSRPSRPCAAHGPQQHVDRVPGRPGRRPDSSLQRRWLEHQYHTCTQGVSGGPPPTAYSARHLAALEQRS